MQSVLNAVNVHVLSALMYEYALDLAKMLHDGADVGLRVLGGGLASVMVVMGSRLGGKCGEMRGCRRAWAQARAVG